MKYLHYQKKLMIKLIEFGFQLLMNNFVEMQTQSSVTLKAKIIFFK